MAEELKAPEWVQGLWRIKNASLDEDEKRVASILLHLLLVELVRIRRIRRLAKLLLDYRSTSPLPSLSVAILNLCQKLCFQKIGYYT